MIQLNLKQLLLACSVLFFTFSENRVNAQPALGITSFENNTGSTISLLLSDACTEGRSATIAGYTFYLRSAVNCAVNNPLAGPTSDGHINLITTPAATGIWQEGRISSSDGSSFKLNTITISALTTPFVGKTITFTGYKEDAPVAGASLVSAPITATGLANQLSIDFTGNVGFYDIDEVRMNPSGTDAQGTISIHAIDISEAGDPLPLFFTHMEAFASETGARVLFETVSESHVKDYEIQLGVAGSDFHTYDRIAAKNGEAQAYSSSVVTSETGNLWVRIKANDMDGAVTYSRIAMVNRQQTKDIVIYPNSAKDVIHILHAQQPNYRILDASGKVVQVGEMVNQQIDISQLPIGLLILQIDGKSYKVTKQ